MRIKIFKFLKTINFFFNFNKLKKIFFFFFFKIIFNIYILNKKKVYLKFLKKTTISYLIKIKYIKNIEIFIFKNKIKNSKFLIFNFFIKRYIFKLKSLYKIFKIILLKKKLIKLKYD